ncbi:hypothetical protein [Nocardioides montaniterrae]
MGARMFNPVSALFTSMDAVWGGNSTAFAYPQDPVGHDDVSGYEDEELTESYPASGGGGSMEFGGAAEEGAAAGELSEDDALEYIYHGPAPEGAPIRGEAGVRAALRTLEKGNNSYTKMVANRRALVRIFQRLGHYGMTIERGGHFAAFELDDGTVIAIRRHSKWGNWTVDIKYPDSQQRFYIHIDK